MCGIAGYKGLECGRSADVFSHTLQHRGPDFQDFWQEGDTLLFHSRLKIIDISEAANQPMISHCGRYVMVYNGEVYNFGEIRREILAARPGTHFRSTSDSEVILEAFILWGTAAVEKFNGMFAFVIFDRQEKKHYLFRDRMGEKPLFVYHRNGIFAFASEMKAISALQIDKGGINPTALYYYLHLGYIPEPFTIWEHIHKFPKASYAVFENNNIRHTQYWQPPVIGPDKRRQLNEKTEDEFEKLIGDAVRMRLISDVPVGLLLSGGTDSGLVASMAQKSSAGPVNTFTIGFDDKNRDESKQAAEVAKYLGTSHHHLQCTEKEAMSLIPEIINIYDEPYADSSAIPTLLVSKLARKHVTVALTGDGGDEQFLGYGAHRWAERFARPPHYAFRFPVAAMLSAGGSRYKRIAGMLRHRKRDSLYSHIFSQEQYMFSEKEIAALIRLPEKPQPDLFNGYCNLDLRPAEKQAFYDLLYYLPDDLLVKTDRASMHYSLELRAPLLDHRLVEFSMSLPYQAKFHNGTAKYLLKKILSRHLPPEWVYRKKQGFSVPLAGWMKNVLKPMVEHYLSEENIRKQGVLNASEVQQITARFYSGGYDFYYIRIWQMMVLQMFFEKHGSA
jgi:asparagine synthase (glutamine-hydrolysing)